MGTRVGTQLSSMPLSVCRRSHRRQRSLTGMPGCRQCSSAPSVGFVFLARAFSPGRSRRADSLIDDHRPRLSTCHELLDRFPNAHYPGGGAKVERALVLRKPPNLARTPFFAAPTGALTLSLQQHRPQRVRQQFVEQRLVDVQTVLGLIVDDRLRAVGDLGGDFLAA